MAQSVLQQLKVVGLMLEQQPQCEALALVLPLWFAEYSRPIAATALALVMTLGMMSIINNVQNIVQMRRKNAFIPKFSL